ncbi:MAG: efflux transporter SaoE [Chitinophagales bacterium]
MTTLTGFIAAVIEAGWGILNEASVWLIISFILAGLLYNYLDPKKFHRVLGNTSAGALFKASVSGMMLPICSCGVIPLGLGLYYSGAYLGPTLAFMCATPIINPAAVLLALGLLGPKIAVIYIVAGFIVPMLVGMVGNLFGGPELHLPPVDDSEQVCFEEQEVNWKEKLLGGIKWGISDMGVQVSKYVIWGMVLAGIITAATPVGFIQKYLGSPGLISIGGIAVLAALMYVCAVGHIPFIAALVAAGASPGVAITFLMAGAATNLPELVSICKLIGRRAAIIYFSCMVGMSILVGWLTNLILSPGFVPFFNLAKGQEAVGWANKLILVSPEPVRYICSAAIVGLFIYAYWPKLKSVFASREANYET